MQQLGYSDQSKHVIYWLLPGKNLADGLRIVDCDTDTLHMTAVVPKFQYFQLFVDHKDMAFDNVMDDIHVSGTPELPLVLSPKSHGFSSGIRGSPRFKVKAHKGRLNQCHAGSSNEGSSSVPPVGLNVGHELRRSRRKLVVEEEIPNENDSDSDDSEWDSDWVDSDNEVGKDDDDLYEEWVDDKFEQKKKKKSKLEQDSDYESDELQELQDSELEDSDSAEEVEVVDAQGRKKMKKKVKLKRWRPENMKEVNFHIGMVFLSVIELRAAIQEYIVKQRVQIHYIKNDKQRIRAGCVGDCPWFLFAAPDSRTKAWVVKKYVGEHTCEREWALKQFTARYLAGKYVETFRADEKMTLQNFGRLVQLDYNMQPTRSKLARARRIALKIIHGDELEQYNLLWDFAAEIRRSNPGSTMLVHANNGKFDNCYMSLDACKRGFLLACRPIICIDGCHIKNKYGGVMLTAVGVDPNDCIFPIAIAIVEVEDTVTWKWFLNTLKEDLNIQNTAPWTLMSDRQKVVRTL